MSSAGARQRPSAASTSAAIEFRRGEVPERVVLSTYYP